MPNFICKNCGTQYAESKEPPSECTICEEEREFVDWSGQIWTTLDELKKSHRNVVRLEELGLYGIGMEPLFGMENSYLGSGPKAIFFLELLIVYEAGHFPCGRVGEWPQGMLRVL